MKVPTLELQGKLPTSSVVLHVYMSVVSVGERNVPHSVSKDV